EVLALRGERRELANGVRQAELTLLAHVLGEDPGIGAIGARVWMVRTEDTFGRSSRIVIVNRNPGLLQRQHHVGLRQAKHRNGGAWFVLYQKVEDRVDRILVPFRCNFAQALALVLQQLLVIDGTYQDILRTIDLEPLVVPRVRGCRHVLAHSGAHGWILEPPQQLRPSAVVCPGWREG